MSGSLRVPRLPATTAAAARLVAATVAAATATVAAAAAVVVIVAVAGPGCGCWLPWLRSWFRSVLVAPVVLAAVAAAVCRSLLGPARSLLRLSGGCPVGCPVAVVAAVSLRLSRFRSRRGVLAVVAPRSSARSSCCAGPARSPRSPCVAAVLLPVLLRSSRCRAGLRRSREPRGRACCSAVGAALPPLALWPPPWAVLMASMRAPLRIPVALMPSPPASCLSSGSNMAFRPPLRAPDASAPAAGAVSVVSVTGVLPLSAVRRGPPAELCRVVPIPGGDSGQRVSGFQEGVGVGASRSSAPDIAQPAARSGGASHN